MPASSISAKSRIDVDSVKEDILIFLPKILRSPCFIANNILDKVSYDDDSYRYEYVIFSDVLRKQKIPQYIDNRKDYGRITFAVTKEEFETFWDSNKSVFTQI